MSSEVSYQGRLLTAAVVPPYVKYVLLAVATLLLGGAHTWLLTRRKVPSVGRRHAGRASTRCSRAVVRFDSTLLRRLVGLLRICFPGAFSPEVRSVFALIVLLFVRTRLTLAFSRIVGTCSKALVQKNFKKLIFSFADMALYALPATATNVGVHYTISSIEWRFRERLQQAIHEEYFKGRELYDLTVSNAVDNPSHRVTSDVQCLSTELAALLPSLIKPSMDIVVFSSALATYSGYGIPLTMFLYYLLVSVLFRVVLPNFATMMASSRANEANLRALHSQLIQHAEEVAFYRGADVERANADRILRSYLRLERRIKRVKWWSALVISLLVDHGSLCVGLATCGLAVAQRADGMDAAGLAELYTRSVRLCTSLSKAIARLFSLHLRVSAVCGIAHRVGELRDTLRSLDLAERDTKASTVKISAEDKIVFKNAGILTPNDKAILLDYSATFEAGRNVLITGCNGAGKTALIRVVSGVWSLRSGSLARPHPSRMFILTQRVYLPPGTLRTQLTYPALEADLRARGLTDSKLVGFAARVGLGGVVEREGGLDAWKEWSKVLSGGERQRLAFVRVLYHQPTFVFLDECTSAVSQNIEPTLYRLLLDEGMTLVTVSHRESLKVFHQDTMKLDGVGGYSVERIDNS